MVKLERIKYIQCYAKNHLSNALSNIHNIRDSVSLPSHLPPALSRESSTQFQRFRALTFTETESETIDFRWFLCTKASRVCSGVRVLLSQSITFLDQDTSSSRLCFIKTLLQDISSIKTRNPLAIQVAKLPTCPFLSRICIAGSATRYYPSSSSITHLL